MIEEARRRQRSRRLRASLAALFLLAGVGALIAATTGNTTPGEPPLHLANEPLPPPARHAGSGSRSLSVHLSPNIEGSQAGWCVLVLNENGSEDGGCGPLPTQAHPLLNGSSSWGWGESNVTTTVVTTPQVAYVLVNRRRRVPTIASPELPYGLRVAVVHTPLPRNYVANGYRPEWRVPTLVALNSHERRISESPDYGDGLPFRDWNRPAVPIRGVCQLHASAGLAGLTAEWGQVATAIHPYPGRIVGHGFLSCVDTEYYIPGRGIRAAVLLDAANPGRNTPADIPGLVPIPRLHGFYNGTGDYDFRGPMTAKREGNAWIVVAGGGQNAEQARIRLLRHLTATLSLPPIR